jgi:hypothetical protein
MPKIPLYQFSPTETSSPNVRVNPQALTQDYAAGAQLGRTIAGVGQEISDFQSKAQDHINQGNLAAEDTERLKAGNAVMNIPIDKKMQGNPELWQKEHDRIMGDYETARDKRLSTYSPVVKEQDTIKNNQYKARVGLEIKNLAMKGSILKANSQLENDAFAKMNQGDAAGAMDSISKMDRTEEEKVAIKQKLVNADQINNYNQKIEEIAALPPATQIEQIAALSKELDARGKDGTYEFGTLKDDKGVALGTLERDNRIAFQAKLQTMRKTVSNQVNAKVTEVINVFTATGSVDVANAQFASAYKSGLIDSPISIRRDASGGMSFSYGIAQSMAATEAKTQDVVALTTVQKRELAADVEAAKVKQAQLEKAQDLTGKAQSGKLSTDDINKLEGRNEISMDQANDLRKISARVASGDLDITKTLELTGFTVDVRGGMLDYAKMAKAAEADIGKIASANASTLDKVTDIERQTWLTNLNKLPISIDAKAKLTRDYIHAYSVDLVSFEANTGMFGTGKPKMMSKLGDRELNKSEIDARSAVALAWGGVKNLGEDWATELLLRQERTLTAFYTSDTYKDDAENAKKAAKMAEDMRMEVSQISARKMLDQNVMFGNLIQ